ncbi:MAG: flagellar biosynthesis anti-sigma factor FlgM [Clostridiaceae bacterium]|nr:flagellar biosynthesis anti-sigma factor FlgM [Clostridiaceae bacterium]
MKIFNNPNITKIMKTYNKNNKPTEKVKEIEGTKDKIEISPKAKEFQVAMQAFKQLPATREDKVAEIKQQIESGSYNVSGKEVVDKIIEGIMMDKKI